MTFPIDNQFEEVKIKKVEGDRERGFNILRDDGWSFFLDKDCPVEPKAGMTVRMYGRGIGAPFRGVFLDGQKVFYRTEDEDKEHREVEQYGADATEWLRRWDDGRNVWSIEMGGMGPGYEQCIQITTAEVLRHLLEAKYDASLWHDKDAWASDRDKIETAGFANERIKALGLSGAQWGAAVSLATKLYMDGPRKIMKEPSIQERKIQVQRTFPQIAA